MREILDNNLAIGEKDNSSVSIKANIDPLSPNKPAIKYDKDDSKWKYSDDGIVFKDIGSGEAWPAYPKTRPSLLLDFANSKTLDPRITFSRASKATRINEFGLIEEVESNVPRFDHDPETLECKGLLIEESRTNLLTHSNQFDNAVWEKLQASVIPYSSTAPDGSFTASKLIPSTTANNSHRLAFNYAYAANTTYVVSAYFKKGENDKVGFRFFDTIFDTGASATFNLTTGEFALPSGVTGGMKAMPNGWYKCYAARTSKSSVSGTYGIAIDILSDVYAISWDGDGSSGIYIWNAQLEVGSFPTSTMPSNDEFTSRASTATYIDSTGKIATAPFGMPRYSYNPENLNVPPKLLLEGASTNLLNYSGDFSNSWWGKPRTTVSLATSIKSPDGLNTAFKLVPTNVLGNHQLTRVSITPVTAGDIYTWSIFAKAGELKNIRVRAGDSSGFLNDTLIDLTTGQRIAGGNRFIVIPLPDGWYRIAITLPISESATYIDFGIWVYDNNKQSNYEGDNSSGIYIWGAQLEKGYLSSYIPTNGSQITRSADVYTSTTATRGTDAYEIVGKDFANIFNNKEGTIVVGANCIGRPNPSSSPIVIGLSDGTNGNRIQLQLHTLNKYRLYVNTLGANQAACDTGDLEFGVDFRCAITYKKDSFGISLNGGGSVKDTLGDIPPIDRFHLGRFANGNPSFSGTFSFIRIYYSQINDSEIQAVTI